MRKFLGVSLVFLVVASMSSIGLLLAAEPTKMPIEAAPSVQQFSPSGQPGDLPPARYPIFTPEGDNAHCRDYLNGLSNQLMGSADPQATLLTAPVNIDAKYRKTGRVLVTWTIRVVGYRPPAYDIWSSGRGGLCGSRGMSWHGTVNQFFGEGNAYSALYVGSKQFKEIAMTIPAGGSSKDVTASDPTHTGSVLLKPSDFVGNTLPARLTLRLKWRNDTSMRLHTDKNFVNLIVTITRD